MSTKCTIVFLILFTLLHLPRSVAMNRSQELLLDVTGIDFPVFFEDESLSHTERNIIIKDYSQVIAGLDPEGMRDSQVRIFERDGGIIRSDNELKYTAKYVKRPIGFEEEFGIIGETGDGNLVIVVPKNLSDGYKKAIHIRTKSKNAYEELDGFIRSMNDLDGVKLPPVRELLYLHAEAKKYEEEVNSKSINEFIDDYNNHQYLPGSLLEFSMKYEKLLSVMYVIDKVSKKRIGELPVIYDDGRWKIFISLD